MKTTNVVDYTEIFEKYAGKWVALEDDEETVVGSSNKAKEAFNIAKEKGVGKPILFKVPQELLGYVGYGR